MKTKYVLIPSPLEGESFFLSRLEKTSVFKKKSDRLVSLFENSLDLNKKIFDSVLVISEIKNFKYTRNSLLRLKIFNYEEIIESRSKNTAAEMGFAAFESGSEEILLVSTSLPKIQGDDEYYKTIEKAKLMAANGEIVVIDFYKDNLDQEFPVDGKDYFRVYCFKAKTYLDELLKFEPEIFDSVKRAHFKKCGSFINELLNEKIPVQPVETAILIKSKKVEHIKTKIVFKE